jgi:general secretion pathway protein L
LEGRQGAAEDTCMLSRGTTAPSKDTSTDIRQALSHAAGMGRRVQRWWLDELRGLIPPRVRQIFGADPVTAQILLDGNGADVRQVLITGLSNAGHSRPERPLDQPSALAWVAKRRRRWGALMRVDVVLPSSCCLVRHRNVPAVAADRIGDVLALEIERATPFGRGDIRHSWQMIGPAPADPAALQVIHVIAKRHLIDPLLAEARSAGVPVSAIDVAGSDGNRIGINLLSRGETPPSLVGRLNRTIGIAAVLLVLVSTVAVVIALQRQDDALARLEAETNAARKEAQAARKRVQDADNLSERIRLLRLRRAEGFRLIAIWEEVTRRLPDTAWLTGLRVENDTLWIDGYARSASELVGLIAASPMFSGVALSAPVVREDGRTNERFQIRMKIEGAGTAGIREAEAP